MVNGSRYKARRDVSLRPATASDCEFAFRVWKAAMERYVEATWGWDESSQRQRQQEEFTAAAYQVIEVAGQPVGTLIAERRPDAIYLSGLYILPEHQGQGYGSQIIASLLSEARRDGLPIRLRVLWVNPGAQRLYERTGFVVTDECEACFLVMERAP